MKIEIRMFGKRKLAKLFISNAEQNIQQEEITNETKKLKDQGCIVVIYRSGKADLMSSTSALLRRNS